MRMRGDRPGLRGKLVMEALNVKASEMEEKEKEALHVLKKDLSKWLSTVLKEDISPDTFLSHLDTGVVLCHLTKLIQKVAAEKMKEKENVEVKVPMHEVRCNNSARKESFQARDNTANFISWCRKLGLDEAVLFESEGLVLHRDERRVILTIMAIARVGGELDMATPKLVEMEKEIERIEKGTEVEKIGSRGDEEVKSDGPPKSKRRRKETLDDKILAIFHRCSCQRKLKAVSHGCGKFYITTPSGRSMMLYVRMLHEKVMVRVGGGWDTLDHFLLKYDPCRVGGASVGASLSKYAKRKSVNLETPPPSSSSRVRQTSPLASSAIKSGGMRKSTSTPSLSSRKRRAELK